MKIANTTNNYIDTYYGSNWFYLSDTTINKTKDFYFEIEVYDYSNYSSGCFGFVKKNTNGRFTSGSYCYYPSLIMTLYPYENIEWYSIFFSTGSVKEIKLNHYSPSYFLNKRIGLRLQEIDNSLIFYIYLEGVLYYSSPSQPINAFGGGIENFYVTAFNQWDHNQITAKFFFDDDCKYHPNIAYLVENDEKKIYKSNSDDTIDLILSDTRFEDLSKDQKTELFAQATFYCNLQQFKSLKQPIKIIKK